MDNVEIDMAVYPHVKEFLLNFHMAKEPFEITMDSLEGKVLMANLHEHRSYKVIPERMTARLKVVLPAYMARKQIRVRTVINFNRYYDRLFKRLLFTWIDCAVQLNYAEWPAVELFMERYGIDDGNYSKETAWRAWMRWKKVRRDREMAFAKKRVRVLS